MCELGCIMAIILMSVKVNDYSLQSFVARRAVASISPDNIYFVRDLRAALIMGISREKVDRQSRGPFPLQSAAIDHMKQLNFIYRQNSHYQLNDIILNSSTLVALELIRILQKVHILCTFSQNKGKVLIPLDIIYIRPLVL